MFENSTATYRKSSRDFKGLLQLRNKIREESHVLNTPCIDTPTIYGFLVDSMQDFGPLKLNSHVENAPPTRFARDSVSGTTVFDRKQEEEAAIELIFEHDVRDQVLCNVFH